MEPIFWFALFLFAYTYIGYPLLMALLACLRVQPIQRRPIRPRVSLLIVAHNEAKVIGERLENCLALDYPREKLEIMVASDGSTDGTAEIARQYEPLGVTVLAFETRRGKPSVLNDVIPKCKGEIVVLGDARQSYDARALAALVENFADPAVGAVSGELMLTGGSNGVGEGVGFYWRYEKFIRRGEAALDSIPVVTGAIYAIRRDLFEQIPADTLVDDMLIPLRIARRGYRVLFEPSALAYDRVVATAAEEFTRKVRTIAGNFQLFARERWLLSPLKNRLWFQTISHKGLRLLAPVFLLGAFMVNSLLLDTWLYQGIFAVQIIFYLAAFFGYLLRNHRGRGDRWLGVPYVFCLLNLTTVVSFYRFITKRQAVTWTKV